jgi:phosphatidylserine/phosphatidylglycerophosphate/cardiolipin synthase-like enzyme
VAAFADISKVISRHRAELDKDGVLTARPGFEAKDGWVTRTPAIVVTVQKKAAPGALPADQLLPEKLGRFPVDVRQASTLKRLQVTAPKRFLQAAVSVRSAARLPEFPAEVRVSDLSPLPTTKQAVAKAPKKPQIPYTAPAGFPLAPVKGDFEITCSASPDSGWETLQAFFGGTRRSLTIGLYDFTSRHVLDALAESLTGTTTGKKTTKKLRIVLDHPPLNDTADQSDEATRAALGAALGANLEFAWALEDRDPFAEKWIYPNAYHIKVAVRDGTTFWLSSGNWNNSNQPPPAPPAGARSLPEHKKDRDWHVVISNRDLSRTFEAYLNNDFKVAKKNQRQEVAAGASRSATAPRLPVAAKTGKTFPAQTFKDTMTVQPVLTPDVGGYVDAVVKLVKSAKKSLLLQYTYIHPPKAGDAGFASILAALVDKQAERTVAVKIILSAFETQPFLEQLQSAGVNLDDVRIQPNVHNKGIVVDSKAVLVSSQNWSTAGVEQNRDAGVLIRYPKVAQYFEAVFLDDWNNRSRQVAAE